MFAYKFFIFNFFELEEFFFVLFVVVFYSFIGIFIIRENFILLLICIEMLFLVLISLFLISGFFFDDLFGQISSFILLTLAAVESSISLALLIAYYRVSGCTSLSLIGLLKG